MDILEFSNLLLRRPPCPVGRRREGFRHLRPVHDFQPEGREWRLPQGDPDGGRARDLELKRGLFIVDHRFRGRFGERLAVPLPLLQERRW